MKKYKIKAKRGNEVKIISGKYKGKTGIVKKIFNETNKIIVENINIKTKHAKSKQSEEKGTLKKIEGPIDYSNVQIL